MENLNELIEWYLNGNITFCKQNAHKGKYNGLDIVLSCQTFGLRPALKVLKSVGVRTIEIQNAFHDFDRNNSDEVLEILLEI